VDIIDPVQTLGDAICIVTMFSDTLPAQKGSLRWCIDRLNAGQLVSADGSRARIHFNMRGTIKLKAKLPDISETVTIDGTSFPDTSAGDGTAALEWMPAVVLDGADAGFVSCLRVRAKDVVIKGLSIQKFERNGVHSLGARMRVIGVHINGAGQMGILLDKTAEDSVVGDPTAGPRGRVVVGGNTKAGMFTYAPNTRIANVYIGLQADGKTANSNSGDGVQLAISAVGSRIGDADAGADGLVVLSGNRIYGVRCFAPHVTIVNTYAGVGADGLALVANGASGVYIEPSATNALVGVPTVDPSSIFNQQHSLVVVSGNIEGGIACHAEDATFGRIYVGIAADGITPAPNLFYGIDLNAQDAAFPTSSIQIGPGAIISGNYGSGILVSMRLHSSNTIIVEGCLIGLVDPTSTAFNAALKGGTNLNALAPQLDAAGNFNHGIELTPVSGADYAITIKHTLIGGNFLTGIDPATRPTAEYLHYTSTNYPRTTPLIGNDRADHVCERCKCTSVDDSFLTSTTTAATSPTTTDNTSAPLLPSTWQIDCEQMADDAQNVFGDRLPTGFQNGRDADHASTIGPLTSLRMAGAGLSVLPWSTELTPSITAEVNLLDLSDNPDLNPLPTSADSQSNTSNTFSKTAFPKLAYLFLQGSDLSGFTNMTLTALAPTLSALDLSRPNKPPNADVDFNFTGFDQLTAVVWFDNTKCPRGFFATAASTSQANVGLCSRCAIGTFQPRIGTIGKDACIACPEGEVDADKDPTTPCTLPRPLLLTADPNLAAEQGYVAVFTDGSTYDFLGPTLAKSKLFANFTGPADKIVYAMNVRSAVAANTNTTTPYSSQPADVDAGGSFFVDAAGNVLAKMTTVGRYTGELFARDSVGAEVSVHTWEFEVIPVVKESFSERLGGSIAAAVLGIIIVALFLTFTYAKYWQRKRAMQPVDFSSIFNRMLDSGEITINVNNSTGHQDNQGKNQITEQSVKLPREIPRRCITKSEKVGQGAFGEVFKGILDETSNNNGVPGYLVACKSVADATGDGADDLLQEATVMAQTGHHVNLVSLIGVITSGLPLLIIMALCENGSLKSQLEKRVLGEGKLVAKQPGARPPKMDADIGVEIARGMQHLVEHNMVHRDLAARNVLLDSQLVSKVADFGLSRAFSSEEGKDYYKSTTGMMALRWTAPEAMTTMKFSMATDVWAFGIVLLEIATDGDLPIKELTNAEIMARMQSGYKTPKPNGCSDAMYAVVQKCLALDPKARPSFRELATTLSNGEFARIGQQSNNWVAGSAGNDNANVGAIGDQAKTPYTETIYQRVIVYQAEVATERSPLEGLASTPIIGLRESIAAAEKHTTCMVGLSVELESALMFATRKVTNGRSFGLTVDQVAAINLYTQESPFYKGLNGAFGGWGEGGGHAAVPHYMFYMKILVDALAALPKAPTTVYRGIRGIPLATVLQGKGVGDELVWLAPTSTTGTSDVLRDPMFFGVGAEHGERIVFVIEMQSGVCIKSFSALGSIIEYYLQPFGSTDQDEDVR
jgi:hypothetical protein